MRGAGAALLLLAGAAALARPEPAAPAGPAAAALFRARCTACHDASRVFHRVAGRDEWREIVDRMRRLPQSGISPYEAPRIVDYLVSLSEARRAGPVAGKRLGGAAAFGDDWIAVLETSTVRGGSVRLGGIDYEASASGLEATLRAKGKSHVVSLTAAGVAGRTARIARWRAGDATYEVHLVLYEVTGASFRVARALRRGP